ncbi:MAG TPA: peptidyl-alpha-hydroxyglycine alpha-amidating lyase family protein [Gemmatimonadales bacterium]|nr:peptidyl-alpha-hydroxyglycine alpha-amidating lyase family protein [Gemmatimonadales bacterium]
MHGWPHVPPGEMLGQVSGVGIDARGDVLVFRRASRNLLSDALSTEPIAEPTVLRFSAQTGELTAAWGARQFAMPHGLSVDHQGNVWLTDIALHQVFKLDPEGHPLLTLGQRGVPGADRAHFNRPTDVAQGVNGSVYISDGYRNTRVIEFDSNGQFVREWGEPGGARGQFNLPHGIAVDTGGRVYVADRGNARIQTFDSTGRFLAAWHGDSLGRPWAVRVGPDGFIYVVDGGDLPEHGPDRARVLKLSLTGEIVAVFGTFGNYDGQFVWPHCIAVASDGSVYVGDVGTGRRIQKFVH